MKIKRIIPVSLTFFILFSGNFIQTGISAKTGQEKEDTAAASVNKASPDIRYLSGSDVEKVLENEYLELYVDKATTAVSVRDKRSGRIWHTNPPGADTDTKAGSAFKERLKAQLIVNFYNPNCVLKTYNNYTESIAYGQFEIKKDGEKLKIVYKVGKEKDLLILPKLIGASRFESEILGKLDDQDGKKIKGRYAVISLSKARDEEHKKELTETYPNIVNEDLYSLRTESAFIMKELEKIVAKTGYTLEDMNKDHVINGVPPEEPNRDVFTITMEYSLEADNLVVSIPVADIEFDSKYPLNSIQVLEFFGAAGKDEKGYIFVPDGSGALIYLNNGKTEKQAVNIPLYGSDKAIPSHEQYVRLQQACLPVFGLKTGKDAFFAVIEEGDLLARIKADIAGKSCSYNYVSPEFTTIPAADVYLGEIQGNNAINLYQDKIYQGDIRIRYTFLNGEKASYSGMAGWYQDYLIKKGVLKKRNDIDKDIPFYLELVGAVDKRKPVLGIPFNVTQPLTTYRQAVEIMDKLLENDIKRIKLKYTGWLSGGIRHRVPSKVSPEQKLGGKKDFEELVCYTRDNGILLYPDVEFQYIYSSSIFDWFAPRRHSARSLIREVANYREFNLATMGIDGRSPAANILSPAALPSLIDKFIKSISRFELKGVSVGSLGADANSDFNTRKLIDRQDASKIICRQLEKLNNSGKDILLHTGNSYTLPYVKDILSVPMESNHFNIADESVPFYQMTVRGFIEYAGNPANLTENYRRDILKTVETGGGIYFTWIYEDNSLLKNTYYNKYYSVNYENWFDNAVKLYNEANKALEDVRGQRIADHQKMGQNVYETTYENGIRIAVNYGKAPVSISGKTVPGESYHVFKE